MIVTNRGVTYTAVDVEARLAYGDIPGTPQMAVFWLSRNDTVADLRFPGRDIRGPGRVEFIRYPDSGVSTSITHPASTVIGA